MSSVYFGTGIRSYRHGLTAALPFEYLDFLCTAFLLADEVNANQVLQEITDVYDNGSVPTCSDDFQVATRQAEIVKSLAYKLSVEDRFSVRKASAFRNLKEFRAIFERISQSAKESAIDIQNEYFLLQSAGLDFFRKTEDVVAKIGWIVDRKKPGKGMDEFAFNQFYQRATGDFSFRFEYIDAVRIPSGNRASPYFTNTSEIEEGRLILSDDKFEGLKIENTKAGRRYLENVENIIKKFESLLKSGTFKFPNKWDFDRSLEEKIIALYDFVICPSCASPIKELRYVGA